MRPYSGPFLFYGRWRRMMPEPKLSDAEFLAGTIEYLRQLTPEEQEAVFWGLEQECGAEGVAKARLLLKPKSPEPEEEPKKAAVAVVDLRARFNQRLAEQKRLEQQAKVAQLKTV